MSQRQLRGYQDAFKSNLLRDRPDDDFLNLLAQRSAEDARMRLNIYRNNVQHSLSSALGDLFPVVKRLIGDRCFNSAAIAYVRKNPPEHAALVFYGESFIDFIAAYPACRHLEYLPDTARLEWYCHQARNAGDAALLDPSSLAEIPHEKLGTLRLTPHPSVQLLESRWPIDDIHLENLNEEVGVIDLDASAGRYVLVWRDELTVRVISLAENCYRLLDALVQQRPIDDAWQSVPNKGNSGELSDMLGYLLGLRLFIDFSVQEG